MITVCSVVYNDLSTGLFDYMVRSVYKYSDTMPKFIISDNGGNDLAKYKEFNIIKNKSNLKGSLQHGDSLNKIIKLSTTEYTAIIESDVVVLNKSWDRITQDLKVAVKVPGFYHVAFLVGKTELLKKIDFRPNGNVNRSYKVNEDVGFRINSYVDLKNIELLNFVDCKSNKGKLFNSEFQSDEFWSDNKIISCHFGRGSNIGGKAIRKGFDHPKNQLVKWKAVLDKVI